MILVSVENERLINVLRMLTSSDENDLETL